MPNKLYGQRNQGMKPLANKRAIDMGVEESHQYRQSSGLDKENIWPNIWPIAKSDGDELESFVAHNRSLSAYSQQLFSEIYRDFSDRNDLFILSDAGARLIILYSCPEILSAATGEVSLRCGVLLSESSCGTNAITLALRYRESVVSSRSQHYGPLFKSCGTVAVPVLDADHQPMVCIAILNCADDSLGEKLLLAKFIAREFGKYYRSPPVPDIGVTLSIPDNYSRRTSPIPQSVGFKVRQTADRRRSQRGTTPAMLAIGLSARQQQVLMLFARGMSYKEIAREIGISSYKTVEEHLDAVREKLHVSHRRECIQKAMSLGLL